MRKNYNFIIRLTNDGDPVPMEFIIQKKHMPRRQAFQEINAALARIDGASVTIIRVDEWEDQWW